MQQYDTFDSEVFSWINKEEDRQNFGLELIASENYASAAVLKAQGSCLTHKYAEGYPGKRYYGGCEFVDEIEKIAIERVKKLFGAESANVQPHSGSSANLAAFLALLKPGDRILGMDLNHGGHLSHGSRVHLSGKWFEAHTYSVDSQSGRIDYDELRESAKRIHPQLIIAGASAYPRLIDFKIFSEIAQEVGAYLLADIAHIAGLVATGLHPSPIGLATVTSSTTHKTLRGPRGGILCSNQDVMKKINSGIFPGTQGGPLMHAIAAKAVAFGEALDPSFKQYQQQTLKNAHTLAESLMAHGFHLLTGGTENHLLLIDLTCFGDDLSGKLLETWCDQAGMTLNKNSIPRDPRPPSLTSGVRIGTPAITTRGMGASEMRQIARWIHEVAHSQGNPTLLSRIRSQVRSLCQGFPLPHLAPRRSCL